MGSVSSYRAVGGNSGGGIRTPRAVSILVGKTLVDKTNPRSGFPADGTM